MVFDPTSVSDIQLHSVAQLAPDGGWQTELVHDRPYSVLIWLTRGQGVALLDGARHGIGLHNAIFIPARQLFSLELGRQVFGQVVVLPDSTDLVLPQKVHHLRIRDAASQTELATMLDAMGREQSTRRPMSQSATDAYARLVLIWLHRHLSDETIPPTKEPAAQTLVRKFCDLVVRDFATGASMADYALALNVTPTHLTRVCRAQCGKTAATILTERQLHAARTLLIATDAPVQDIAQHLGFGSAAYFTRFIQNHTKQSPSSLRRAARQKPS